MVAARRHASLQRVQRRCVFDLGHVVIRSKVGRFGDVATSTMSQTMFSPDGKWLAYRSQGNIYAQPFPATQAKYQVSAGYAPAWSRDGQQLFFAIGAQRAFRCRSHSHWAGGSIANREEFAAPDVARGLTIRPFDVTPDGRSWLLSPQDRRRRRRRLRESTSCTTGSRS